MSDSESLQKVESGPSFEVWRFRSSMLRLDYRRAGIVEMIVIGHGHVEFTQPCHRRWDEALRKHDRLTILADFWNMPGYDSGFRLGLTDWVARHRTQMDPIHVLTRSQLVSMGVAVANIALGGLIKVHTLKTSYDRVVEGLAATSKSSAGADPSSRRRR